MKTERIEKIRPDLNNTKTWKESKIVEISCDICGGSCENVAGTQSWDDPDKKVFDFLKLEASWGFFSDWDGENWDAYICTQCIKAHILPLVKINVRSYFRNNEEEGQRINGEMVYIDEQTR